MLAQLLTETLLGALTGYITNDTAIRSLFRPGGVIEKTRDDFAREAGLLLEDQVLTRAVLERQIALPEVQQTLAEALRDFLEQRLSQAIAQQKLGDLPDYAEIAAFLQEVLLQFVGQEREQILLLLKKHLPVGQIFTEEQCHKLCSQLERLLLDALQQEAFVVTIWNGWQSSRGSETLEELGLASLCDTVLQHAAALSRNWPQQIQEQYGEQLQPLLLKSIQKLELRPVLLELDGAMAQYTLRQYLYCEKDELADILEQMFASAEGQALSASITAQLLSALETIDVPAAEVMPDGLLEELAPLLQQQVPLVMERMLDWLRANSDSVNKMLESAVEEIASEIGGMKGMLLEQLKETVLAQFLEQSSLVDLLQQTVMTEQTSHDAVTVLMQQIEQQLTEQKLGDLIRKLNENRALEMVLKNLLRDNLQRMLLRHGALWMEKLLNWKPGSLKLAERQEQIETWLANLAMRGIDKLDLEQMILHQRERLRRMPMAALLAVEDAQLQIAVEQAVHRGCNYLADTLPQCSADRLYRPLYDGLGQLLEQSGQQWIQNQLADYTVQDLLSLARTFLQERQPQMITFLSQTGLDLMQGQLSQLAEEQIQRLDSDEMLTLVRDLMGQELQPLNYLGAGMGAIAGATVGTALSTAVPVTAAIAPAMMTSVLAGKSAVFGAVGYVTNCAAVKGLFWPYEPVAGVEMIQGVIPKQKKRFSRSMGKLVDRYVINEVVLSELLQKAEANLRVYGDELAQNETMMQWLVADLAANRTAILQLLTQWLEQNGARSCHAKLEPLGDQPFTFLHSDGADLFFSKRQLEEQLLPMAEQWLYNQMHSPIPLKQLIAEDTFWKLAQQVIVSQELSPLEDLTDSLLHSEQSFQQLLGDRSQQELRDTVEQFLEQWLQQKANRENVVDVLGNVLSAERLKQWLEQNSGDWVTQNVSSLFGMVEQTILQLLQGKQTGITEAVQSAILNRMGLMQQMGYAMMGGNAIVDQVVDRILNQKLPIFLSLKSRELQQVVQQYWQQDIFPAVLQVPLEQEQMEDVLTTLLEQPVVYRSIRCIGGQAVEQLAVLPVNCWGQYVRLNDLLRRVQIPFGYQWQRNRVEAIQNWAPLAQSVYDRFLGAITLQQLTGGYQGHVSLQNLLHYDGLSDTLQSFQLHLQERVAITQPRYWLNWPEMVSVLDCAVASLLHDENTRQWIHYKGQILLLQLTEQWQRLLPEASRTVLLQPIMHAGFGTAEAYGTQLLQAMELSNLTETQLIAMDSAHLERVVRGFAGHYLVHIENRGWMGALFALPGMLIYLF